MANNSNMIPIPGRLHSVATDGQVAGANEIHDDAQNKKQSTINSELINAVGSGGSVDSRIADAKAEIIGDAATDYNTLGKLEDKVQAEASRAEGAESALDGRVDTLEDAVGTGGSVDSRISAAVATETTRAQAAEADRYTKSETYTKTEVNGLVDTPHQEYVTVATYASLPASGSADTIYRVSSYDGANSQVDDTVYSEYAWDGTQYVFLCVKSQIDEVFDITVYNSNTKYADLAAALGVDGANIPQSLRKGGMSVKFVQSSDNKYVQYRYISNDATTVATFTNLANWEKQDVSLKDFIINWNELTNTQKYILSCIEELNIEINDSLRGDNFSIFQCGVSSGNFYFGIRDITKGLDIFAITKSLNSFGNDLYEKIEKEYNYAKGGIVVNVPLLQSIGFINDTSLVVKFNYSLSNFGVFAGHNISVAAERNRLSAIKQLNVYVSQQYINKDIYLTGSGWYSGIGIYCGLKCDGVEIFGTSIPSASKPSGVKSYEFSAVGIKVDMTVDWDTLNPAWYNETSSQLKIKQISLAYGMDYPSDGANKQTYTPVKQNLFDVNEILLNKRLVDNVQHDDNERFIGNKFAVKPNSLYKSNYPFTYLNYYKADGTFNRCTAVEGQKNITPNADDYFVCPSGLKVSGELSDIIIHKVDALDNEIDDSAIYNKKSTESLALNAERSKGYIYGLFDTGVEYSEQTSTISLSIETSGNEKLFAIPVAGTYSGKIVRIRMKINSSATYVQTFGIGTIDQRGWGLLRYRFEKNVKNGYNDLSFNVDINKGEVLFLIANNNSSSASVSIIADTKGYHYESEENAITMVKSAGALCVAYTVEGKQHTVPMFASQNDLSAVSESISNVKESLSSLMLDNLKIQSPNDTYFKLAVANDGTLSAVEIPLAGKILVMGNSYDVHGVVSGLWWGDFGMAASRKENDWKHLLLARLLREENLLYGFNKCALSNWETAYPYTTFDYSTLDSAFTGETYDLIVIRIGENNQNHTEYSDSYNKVLALINYIRTKSNAPIIFGGALKYGVANNAAYQAAVETFENTTYVDMTPAGQVSPFAAGLDYRVFGDDGQWHTISDSSQASAVANHPNDYVMQAMSNILYPVVLDKLT